MSAIKETLIQPTANDQGADTINLCTVDIGIVTWNRLALTIRCIESLVQHADHPFRLFVADNGSSDGTRDYLLGLYEKGIIHRLLLFDKNYGIAPASNSLWELSDSKFYLKLDNDVEIKKKGWLTEMASICLRNQEVGILAFSFQRQLYQKQYPLVHLDSGDVVQDSDETLGGACILLTRLTHHRLGFWCEDYAPYGEEDAEYCQRAQLQHIKMYYLKNTDWMVHLSSCPEDQPEAAKEYRKFKQAHRKKNTAQTGLCSINVLMYNLNMRPLYMRRKFKTIIAEDGISARMELSRDYLYQEGKRTSALKRLLQSRGGFTRQR